MRHDYSFPSVLVCPHWSIVSNAVACASGLRATTCGWHHIRLGKTRFPRDCEKGLCVVAKEKKAERLAVEVRQTSRCKRQGVGGWSGVEVQRGKRGLGAGGGQLGRPYRLGAGRGMGPQPWDAGQHHCQRRPGWESHHMDREGVWRLGPNGAA